MMNWEGGMNGTTAEAVSPEFVVVEMRAALQAIDQLRKCDRRWVVNKQVNVIIFTIKVPIVFQSR